MRVMIVTNMYPTVEMPSFATFVHDQVEALRREGVEIEVFFFNGRKSKWNYLWAFPRFWWRLLRNRYDLIHAHYVLAGVVARAQWSHRLVLTHHGGEALGMPPWQGPICRLLSPLCDEVIHVTEEIRRAVRDDDGWVIPCGVDIDHFAPVPQAQARECLALPADQPLILFAGEYRRPEKRFDLVEAAMARVRQTMPEAELILLTGRPHETVPAYMSACDVLVLASDFEGSPMVVKEAMAVNLPVVSVRVGDVPELIGSTPGCFLAERDADDIAAKLVATLRERRRTDGRARIAHLRHDRTAQRVLEVYRRAIAPRSGVKRHALGR